ncbi:amidohydrolase [Microbacterium sp. cx-55]|uniref:amidohydrolase n=1 Tax=Microbacterium sp. cx-55 TaxID=2875948 RepID=UPI001CC0CB38|nr:amidohydrolase [Microbacterium sp. cx-55]MBZ4487943.1 amidohydrolase [Microbacterium sp. cx-55]UGB34647.1 amidohydrolase [Microbacterium sp. cx-55]
MTDFAAPLADLYRDLHRHPEPAFEETRTAGVAAACLRYSGYEVIERVGRTGVVGVLRNGEGPTVLIRADMDALPVHEDTGLDYASTVEGMMHACGHDVHVAALIGAADRLAQTRHEWSGTVIALFQPAEESGDGAQAMIDDGLYEKVPLPDVVLGQHVGPAPAGVVGAHSGPAFAGANSIDITVYGRGGHGSRPETTIDPIVLAASIVLRLQTIVAREVAPQETAVVTVGRISAGTKNNIIPDTASLGLTVRAFSEPVRIRIIEAIERIVRGEAAVSGAPEPRIHYAQSFPVMVNDPDGTARTNAAFRAAFGDASVLAPGAVSGSEDVGILAAAAQAPLVYWILGGADAALYMAAAAAGTLDSDVPSNHSPHFAPIIEPTLARGVDALVVAARAWLAPQSWEMKRGEIRSL